MTDRYSIRRIKSQDISDPVIKKFLVDGAIDSAKKYGGKFNWRNFKIKSYADRQFIVMCFRNEVPVGAILYQLYPSVFDEDVRILYQDSLYALPGTRAPLILLKHFIDFGRQNADHIITCIGAETNIKGKSLEKLGFTKLEETYRIEVLK